MLLQPALLRYPCACGNLQEAGNDKADCKAGFERPRMGQIWSGKRGSNSRPIPWQGIALPTELFPHVTTCVVKIKTHHEDAFLNLVAWGGIEPPTQGFSILCSTD